MIKKISTIKEMRDLSRKLRSEGKVIGLVPTMGYLHDAHLSLVSMAKEISDVVIVTIFVNPVQFGPGEDFERYPRDEEGDSEKLIKSGVDILFMPSLDEMYPSGYETYIDVTRMSKGLCGDFRPGHFRGVATVVAKLINATLPHKAVFGEKDYQQLLVIRKMVEDLNFDLEVVSYNLVRERDGLAMSSRNAYLTTEDREKALALSRSLNYGKDLFESGERRAEVLRKAVFSRLNGTDGVDVQYVEVRDAETLDRIEEIEGAAVVAVAAIVGPARLIDNIILGR